MLDRVFESVERGGKLEEVENANKTFRFVQGGGQTQDEEVGKRRSVLRRREERRTSTNMLVSSPQEP